MDTTKELSAIEWCAGYGGIHLGLKRAIPNLRVIAYGEIEAFACANLVAKMEAGLLDAAPIWTDIKTFPCEAFRDRVDLLVAGYPCQPFSAAGKRLGAEDPRHLWPHILGAIRIIRPRICFFENVEGHISLGLREVLRDLGATGYTAAWGIFSASEVGAPHQRKRVFILAVSNSHGGAAGLSRSLAWNEGIAGEFDHGGGKGGDYVAYDQSEASRRLPERAQSKITQLGLNGQAAWPSRPGEPQHAWEPPRVVADSKKSGRTTGRVIGDMDCETGSEGSRGHQPAPTAANCGDAGAAEAMGNASQREDLGRESRDLGQAAGEGRCGNDAADGTSEVLADNLRGRLQNATDQQRNSGADDHAVIRTCPSESGWRQAQSPLGRDPHGPARGMDYAELCISCDNRTDELRLLGNGVVPATAERAFRVLMHELCSNT